METPKNRRWPVDVEDVRIIPKGPNKVRYGCPMCVREFSRKHNLYEHCRFFHPNKMRLFGCSYRNCPRAFINKFRLRRHTNRVHRLPTNDTTSTSKKLATEIVYANVFCCSYCPKILGSVFSKEKHEKLHTGDRSYFCKMCSASFHFKYAYAKHLKECSHLGNAKWCRFCDFHTFNPAYLEGHYRRMHDFQFISDIEKNFLNQEMTNDGILELNSNRVEDVSVVSRKNIPINDLKCNESSERKSEIFQSSDEVEKKEQDDFKRNSDRVDDSKALSPKSVPIKAIKILKSALIIQDDNLKSDSERFDDAMIHRDKVTGTYKQSNHKAEIPQSTNESEVSRDSNSDIELRFSSESDIEEDVSPQDAKIADSIDEKLIKHEIEVAQLDNNLREIFTNSDPFKSERFFETNPPCQVVDLTLNNDEYDSSSRIIVIDEDD